MNANFIYQVTDKDELSAAVSAYLLGFDGLLNSVHSAYTMQLLDIEDACEYVPLYGEDIWERLYKYAVLISVVPTTRPIVNVYIFEWNEQKGYTRIDPRDLDLNIPLPIIYSPMYNDQLGEITAFPVKSTL